MIFEYALLRQIIIISVALLVFMLFWNYRQRKTNNELIKVKEELEHHKERYDILAEQSGAFTWEVDGNGLHTYISNSVEKVLGYHPDEVIGKLYFYDFIAPKEYEEMKSYGLKYVREGQPFKNLEVEQQHKDGRKVYTLSNGVPIYNKNQKVIGYRGTDTDITKRKKMQDELIKSEQQYRFLFENAVEGIVVIQDGRFKLANPMASETIGYSNDELLQMSIIDIVDKEDQEKIVQVHKERIAGKKDKVKETFRVFRKDGKVIWVEFVGIKIIWNDRPASINFFTDITDRKKKDEAITFLSYYDQLTKLYNRRFFEEELARLDNPRNLPLTLVVMDINGLKLFNDGFGHQIGDKLLQTVAEIINTETRANDIAARIGGDEFVVLMTNTDKKMASAFIERVQKKMKNTKVKGFAISFSLGYGIKYDTAEDIKDIFKKAEGYMYEKKIIEGMKYREIIVDQILEDLFARNPYEKTHAENVANIMEKFAMYFKYDEEKKEELKRVGYYHDIGKVALEDEILLKPSMLNSEEKKEISRHPEKAYQILKASNKYLSLANIVLYHHEKSEGTGYPKKIKKVEIPIESRMLAIAEAYDELVSPRPYKKEKTKDEALTIIREGAGSHFDPELTEIFINHIV